MGEFKKRSKQSRPSFETNSPFVYNHPVEGNGFLNYSRELSEVTQALKVPGTLYFVSAYSGYGKTSFAFAAMKAIKRKKEKNVVTYVSLQSCKTATEFCISYVGAIAQSLGVELKDGWHTDMSLLELVELPERLANQYKKNVVAFLDDFDSISGMTDQLQLEALLRSYWQCAGRVSICALMKTTNDTLDLFGSHSRPFFHTGMFMMLGSHFEADIWSNHIQARFKKAQQRIEKKTLRYIFEKMNFIPRSIQLLCHLIYLSGKKIISAEIIDSIIMDHVNANAQSYKVRMKRLTKYQKHVLIAYVNNVKIETRQQVKKKTLDALDGIIGWRGQEKVRFLDPFFEIYLRSKHYY